MKQVFEDLTELAGIKINGNNPWDIQVHDPRTYQRVLAQGSLGLGESYMDGWWDCQKLDQFFERVLKAGINEKVRGKGILFQAGLAFQALKARVSNPQSIRKSKRVAQEHYDLGNDFYAKMLGSTMQYSCGYWKEAKTLDQAQEHKMDLICRKLQLKKGEKVLELGCGWGTFAKFMAEKYGSHVTAYNISEEQVEYAREINKDLPVKIIHEDYRNAKGLYDKVVSIGFYEHVGPRNYRAFMKLVNQSLKPKGLFLLHTIGRNISAKPGQIDAFTNKYIFPGGHPPSIKQITDASEGLFVTEDLHNFGADYDPTLMAWNRNFQDNWPEFQNRYGSRFKRMWEYYLLSCAGAFRARDLQLYQTVFSKNGVKNRYESVR